METQRRGEKQHRRIGSGLKTTKRVSGKLEPFGPMVVLFRRNIVLDLKCRNFTASAPAWAALLIRSMATASSPSWFTPISAAIHVRSNVRKSIPSSNPLSPANADNR